MTISWGGRAKQMWQAVSKQVPAPLAPPDTFPIDEVAEMLRDIGIALIEVQVPSGVVESRLERIARRYTSEPVRVVALPTVLIVQVGKVGHEVAASTGGTTQLDRAGKVDAVARLATAVRFLYV